MRSPLLSIITPTYNCGTYIHRLLNSILQQTYDEIEMIVVDDGSTDNTKEIIYGYMPKFRNRGYSIKYLWQENQGQSVAINHALKLIKGEYLTWPDADDWYKTDDALERLIEMLEKSDKSIGMIRCEVELVDEATYKANGHLKPHINHYRTSFDDCFFERNGFWFGAGCYVARVSSVDKTISERDIYTEKAAGQNIQIFYPILYSYDCITINVPLYCILSRMESHSRKKRSLTEQADRLRVYARTRLNTLERIGQMPKEEKMKYRKYTLLMYRNDILHMYISDRNLAKAKEFIKIIKKDCVPVPWKYRLAVFLMTIKDIVYRDDKKK